MVKDTMMMMTMTIVMMMAMTMMIVMMMMMTMMIVMHGKVSPISNCGSLRYAGPGPGSIVDDEDDDQLHWMREVK